MPEAKKPPRQSSPRRSLADPSSAGKDGQRAPRSGGSSPPRSVVPAARPPASRRSPAHTQAPWIFGRQRPRASCSEPLPPSRWSRVAACRREGGRQLTGPGAGRRREQAAPAVTGRGEAGADWEFVSHSPRPIVEGALRLVRRTSAAPCPGNRSQRAARAS